MPIPTYVKHSMDFQPLGGQSFLYYISKVSQSPVAADHAIHVPQQLQKLSISEMVCTISCQCWYVQVMFPPSCGKLATDHWHNILEVVTLSHASRWTPSGVQIKSRDCSWSPPGVHQDLSR